MAGPDAAADVAALAGGRARRCQSSFEGIAKATGGQAFALSVTKVEGRELLIGQITTSILKYVGGDGKGDELVGAYIKKFGKMHS